MINERKSVGRITEAEKIGSSPTGGKPLDLEEDHSYIHVRLIADLVVHINKEILVFKIIPGKTPIMCIYSPILLQ